MAQALCESILGRVRQFDERAEIASVRRTEEDGSMRVRLLATKADAQAACSRRCAARGRWRA